MRKTLWLLLFLSTMNLILICSQAQASQPSGAVDSSCLRKFVYLENRGMVKLPKNGFGGQDAYVDGMTKKAEIIAQDVVTKLGLPFDTTSKLYYSFIGTGESSGKNHYGIRVVVGDKDYDDSLFIWNGVSVTAYVEYADPSSEAQLLSVEVKQSGKGSTQFICKNLSSY